MEKRLACAFTGHRIEKLPFLRDENDPQYKKVKQELFCNILALTRESVSIFMTGMATGIDQLAAETVLSIRDVVPDRNIQLWAIIPYDRQALRGSEAEQKRYQSILAKADDTIYVNHEYRRGCLHERNRFMVDNATHLITVYDAKLDGGTKYTIDYARKKGLNITIIEP